MPCLQSENLAGVYPCNIYKVTVGYPCSANNCFYCNALGVFELCRMSQSWIRCVVHLLWVCVSCWSVIGKNLSSVVRYSRSRTVKRVASRDYRFGQTADGTVPDAVCTAVLYVAACHIRWATMVVPSGGRKNSWVRVKVNGASDDDTKRRQTALLLAGSMGTCVGIPFIFLNAHIWPYNKSKLKINILIMSDSMSSQSLKNLTIFNFPW